MNDLACGVKSCAYNDCNCCKRDGIKVEGTMAERSSATCCASFCECGSPRVTSACECEPKRVTNIICDAVKCRYNDDKNCTAKHVDVTGTHAMISSETECATFVSR